MIHQPITNGSQVLAHDGFDVQAYAEASKLVPKLPHQLTLTQLKTAEALTRDFFWSFYKYSPRLEPLAPLTAAHEINRQLVEEILATREWRDLKQAGTVGDELTSAMATFGVASVAITALDNATVERINELHDLESEARNLLEQAQSLEEAAANAPQDRASSLLGFASKWRKQAQESQTKAAAAALDLEATAERRTDAVRRVARVGARIAQEDIEELKAAIQTFGGDGAQNGFSLHGSGNSNSISVKEKLQIAQRVGQSHRLKKIAQICGRFTQIALQTQKEKVETEKSEITSITTGNDLARLLPVETALLSDPDLEELFYLRLSEANLMQYKLSGTQPKGKGSIILAIDSSGSMDTIVGSSNFTAEVWSKSVMLAILAIAKKQKRNVAVLYFAGYGSLRTYRFLEGQATYDQLITCADYFDRGGTYFEQWMRKAQEIIQEDRFDKADVICISDGLTSITPPDVRGWQRLRDERGTRCLSVLIGTDQGRNALEQISDSVMTLNDLSQDTQVLKELFSI